MKIVFILNSIQNQRCLKRIDEFIDHGYEVEAYGFSRKTVVHTYSNKFSVNIIGEFSNKSSYCERLFLMMKAISQLIKRYRNCNVIWYCFGLDIMLLFRLLKRKSYYIYEESDLVHTYLPYHFLIWLFEKIDLYLIKKSLVSVFTSEGFVKYHFDNKPPVNAFVVTNRLNVNVLNFKCEKKKKIDENHIDFAFVGGARFNSLLNFSNVLLEEFSNHSLHFYGEPTVSKKEKFYELKKYSNVYFHGPFKNPDDLVNIYQNIDIVISTYDVKYENVRYAEPNKLYEAIYFRTPIIVSQNTFLAEKVKQLNIGFTVDPLNRNSIIDLINNLTKDSIEDKIRSCELIPQYEAINVNTAFFDMLKDIFNKINKQ